MTTPAQPSPSVAPLKAREVTAALRRYYPAPVPVRWDATPYSAAYHGTAAELEPGDLITPGHGANFDWSSPEHVYFTDEAHYGEAVKHAKHIARAAGAGRRPAHACLDFPGLALPSTPARAAAPRPATRQVAQENAVRRRSTAAALPGHRGGRRT